MRRRSSSWCLSLILSVACSSPRVPQTATPAPMPSPPVQSTPNTGSWTFRYSPGPVAYQVSRSATIESRSDSSVHRETSTNATHELLTLQLAGDAIYFTAVIDTFSTTTQGAIGPVQTVPLPVQLSGFLTADSIRLSVDSLTDKCNPVSSTISTDLHNLLIHFPRQLSVGTSWRDSVELNGCQGMIQTTSHIVRSFSVSGQTEYQGYPVFVVQRSDVIQARGEGTQQQHLVELVARGTGNATYYVSVKGGQIMRLTIGQELNLTITASGKANRFAQISKQDFSSIH